MTFVPLPGNGKSTPEDADYANIATTYYGLETVQHHPLCRFPIHEMNNKTHSNYLVAIIQSTKSFWDLPETGASRGSRKLYRNSLFTSINMQFACSRSPVEHPGGHLPKQRHRWPDLFRVTAHAKQAVQALDVCLGGHRRRCVILRGSRIRSDSVVITGRICLHLRLWFGSGATRG